MVSTAVMYNADDDVLDTQDLVRCEQHWRDYRKVSLSTPLQWGDYSGRCLHHFALLVSWC